MHSPCREIVSFDAELAELVADLVATMYAAEGVGLAANQIGVSAKVFVFDCPDDDGATSRGVVCNPRLLVPEGRDRTLQDGDEGCLSLPGAFVDCPRPDFSRVEGVDQTGRSVAYEGTGLLARCLHHESDHLEGIVFGDRLATRVRKKLWKEASKVAQDYPPGWPAHQAD